MSEADLRELNKLEVRRHLSLKSDDSLLLTQARLVELRGRAARSNQSSKRVKHEEISHQGVFSQGEVIDLT